MPDFTESRFSSLSTMVEELNRDMRQFERAKGILQEDNDRLRRERDVLENELREAQRLIKALIDGMKAEGITLKVAS